MLGITMNFNISYRLTLQNLPIIVMTWKNIIKEK